MQPKGDRMRLIREKAVPCFGILSALCGVLIFSAAAFAAAPGQNPDRAATAERNMQKFLGSTATPLSATDPDFATLRDRLMYGEIAEGGTLNDVQRSLITLVVLTSGQTLENLNTHVEAALRVGATPVEIKEALYQCAPYIGFPRTEAALSRVNEVFQARNIPLPVESRSTVTEENRYDEGLKVQKSIFGAAIDKMHEAAPASQRPIMQNYLSAFCFGDVYTRKGLDLKTRELLTFSIIAALGGCESQVRSHVQGNAAVGNSKENLIDALAWSLPYIGFPRTLNALACVNAVLPEQRQAE